ncbi:hypothetical protein HDU92_003942 [Lobulomyces angularis]|nr:hypothetical protein HDU92_003942 [Lobulomyces angularis]
MPNTLSSLEPLIVSSSLQSNETNQSNTLQNIALNCSLIFTFSLLCLFLTYKIFIQLKYIRKVQALRRFEQMQSSLDTVEVVDELPPYEARNRLTEGGSSTLSTYQITSPAPAY